MENMKLASALMLAGAWMVAGCASDSSNPSHFVARGSRWTRALGALGAGVLVSDRGDRKG